MNRFADDAWASISSDQLENEAQNEQSELLSDVQKMIAAHPVVSINAALLVGVAVGWLAKRL